MAKNKLFQDLDLNHKPKRNGYDLSKDVAFTSKAGELLPLVHRTMMPGDNFKISFDMFSRARQTISKPYTQIREYVDVFFVPYRILWKGAKAMQTNNKKNPDIATSAYSNRSVGDYAPRYDAKYYRKTDYTGSEEFGILANLAHRTNQFGFNRGVLSAKLSNHLGYGYLTIDNIKNYVQDNGDPDPLVTPQYLSLYPWLAYQCIYYKFYRNSQWEDNQPYNYNVDYLDTSAIFSVDAGTNPNNYWDNPTLFDLRYSNYPRDLFFGVFPDAQLGDEAEVDIDFSNPTGSLAFQSLQSTGTLSPNGIITASPEPLEPQSDGVFGIKPIPFPGGSAPNIGSKALGISGSGIQSYIDTMQGKFGILELRKAQFEQRYKEILGSGQNEYRTIIRKIFGVEVPDDLADIPLYLGGHTNMINFNEVTNTNLTDGATATIGSKGIGSSSSDSINFTAKEHGLLMVIYHNQPVIKYALNALHFDVVKTEFDDFANPVFDQLGFQELPAYFLDCTNYARYSNQSPSTPFRESLGFTNRYFDYKTDVDSILGDFRETNQYWFAPVNFEYLKNYVVNKDGYRYFDLNYNFFKVNPKILDSIFVVECGDYVDTDQIETVLTYNCSTVRPLDYHGVPY